MRGHWTWIETEIQILEGYEGCEGQPIPSILLTLLWKGSPLFSPTLDPGWTQALRGQSPTMQKSTWTVSYNLTLEYDGSFDKTEL